MQRFSAVRQCVVFHLSVILIAGVMASLTAGPARAQDNSQPGWLEVRIVHVKSDRVGEFESLVKQMTAAQAKMGVMTQVWSVIAGSGYTYHILVPRANLGAMDNAKPPMAPAALAAWIAQVNSTISSSKHFFARGISQLAAGDGMPPATLSVLRTVTVVSGKQDEFMDWVAKDLTPVMKKIGEGMVFSQGALGDSPRNFYFAGGVANWAAFDQPDPMVKELGQKGMTKLLDKLDGIVAGNKVVILQPRPDLMAAQ